MNKVFHFDSQWFFRYNGWQIEEGWIYVYTEDRRSEKATH
mgnify:CR=1 FL=1